MSESGEKEDETTLLAYGCYSKSMDALRHYDSIQSANEGKISDANWYAVVAAGFLFSITKNPHLTLITCIAIGIVVIVYITTCYLTALVSLERYIISFFYQLLKTEEENEWFPPIFHCMFAKGEKISNRKGADSKGNKNKKYRLVHHGSSYRKACYYMINLIPPFVVLIFSPAYFLLKENAIFENKSLFLVFYTDIEQFENCIFLIYFYAHLTQSAPFLQQFSLNQKILDAIDIFLDLETNSKNNIFFELTRTTRASDRFNKSVEKFPAGAVVIFEVFPL